MYLIVFSVLFCELFLDGVYGYRCFSCKTCGPGALGSTRVYCPFGCYVQRASTTSYQIRYDQGCYDPRQESLNNFPNFYSCFEDFCNLITRLNNSNKIQISPLLLIIIGIFLYFVLQKE
ncbi:unnamed protein product [Brachionus calyciflorus]|uniref:Uncharacterized protein n=1 Tax=Brachionus calyciflorus TaxID=104777 RepID=A0A814MHF1_9BILA|nr:unnamed protein product [Brachionus calyciflorus]